MKLEEIKPTLIKNLDDLLIEEEKGSDYFTLISKDDDSLISFNIKEKKQTSPQKYYGFEIGIKVGDIEDLNYLLKRYMIPINRASSLFRNRALSDILINTNNINNSLNNDFNLEISVLRNNNQEKVLDSLSELIKYTTKFINIHKELLSKGKNLKLSWNNESIELNENDIKELYSSSKIKIKKIPFFKENSHLYLIVDYNCPANLNIVMKNYMFPEGRLGSIFRTSFPEPRIYLNGEKVISLSPNILGNLPNVKDHRVIYRMDFDINELNKFRYDKTIDLAKEYIRKFINLHYITFKKNESK